MMKSKALFKKIFYIYLVFSVIFAVILALVAGVCVVVDLQVKTVTDVEKYGVFPDRFSTEADYAMLLFPERIEDYFDNVVYSCFTDSLYGVFGVWLEVNIDDTEQYEQHKAKVLSGRTTQAFKYDPAFEEYVIADKITTDRFTDGDIALSKSNVLKVLFCDETQTVIYVDIYIPSAGALTSPEEFMYFERFSIDIID